MATARARRSASVASQLAVVGTFERRPPDIFDPHPRDAIAFEFKQFGGLVRDVDQPVAVVGAAVVDADDQRFAVARDW